MIKGGHQGFRVEGWEMWWKSMNFERKGKWVEGLRSWQWIG